VNDLDDIPFLRTLQHDLVTAARGPQARRHLTARSRTRVLTAAASTVAVAGATTLGLFLSGTWSDGPTHQTSGSTTRLGLAPIACEKFGNAISLDRAVADASYHVLMPHDPLANPSSLQGIWHCGTPGLQMHFTSGIRLYLDRNTMDDPAAAWRNEAAGDPTTTTVGTVQGQPALLIDPSNDPNNPANGSVTFVEGDTWLVIEGNGTIPITDLVRVANSLQVVG
jgi:hypothetical protein